MTPARNHSGSNGHLTPTHRVVAGFADVPDPGGGSPYPAPLRGAGAPGLAALKNLAFHSRSSELGGTGCVVRVCVCVCVIESPKNACFSMLVLCSFYVCFQLLSWLKIGSWEVGPKQ